MGYTIQKGRNKLTTEVVDLKNYTRKKKDLKRDKNEGVNLKGRSDLFRNCRIKTLIFCGF